MPRDLKLALGCSRRPPRTAWLRPSTGFGNFYEKGLGTPRDLALAKAIPGTSGPRRPAISAAMQATLPS